MCLPADIWVLSADCQWDVKRRKKELYNRAVKAERHRQTDRDEDRAPERDKKGKHITL